MHYWIANEIFKGIKDIKRDIEEKYFYENFMIYLSNKVAGIFYSSNVWATGYIPLSPWFVNLWGSVSYLLNVDLPHANLT